MEIVSDENNRSCIPSVVAFSSDGAPLVGPAAKAQAQANARNTLYDAKRFIGKRYDPEVVARESRGLPFEVMPVLTPARPSLLRVTMLCQADALPGRCSARPLAAHRWLACLEMCRGFARCRR